ncbi:unnamed protein product [Brassica rapa subsp. narinosa]
MGNPLFDIYESGMDQYGLPIQRREMKHKGRNVVWSVGMDKCLIEALAFQAQNGNKVDKCFNENAYSAACLAVNTRFNLNLNSQKVINRLKTIKKRYRVMKDILSRDGFWWNATTKMIDCESDELWKRYIAVHPDAKAFKGKQIEMYEELRIVCGDHHQAPGRYAKVKAESNHHLNDFKHFEEGSVSFPLPSSEDNNSDTDGTESYAGGGGGDDEYLHEEPQDLPPRNPLKQPLKRPRNSDPFQEAMLAVASSIRRLADAVEGSKSLINTEELLEAVMEIDGLEEAKQMYAFEYLNGDPVKARAFMAYNKLLEKVKQDRKKRIERRAVLNSAVNEKASKDEEVDHRRQHRHESGEQRHRVRRSGERYKPRHDHESHSRLTKDDARHRISTQNRNDHLNASRDRRVNWRDETSFTKISREQSARGNPPQTSITPTQRKSFDEALGDVREAMAQYTQVANPTESASRRNRMCRAEEPDEFEIVAAGIVENTMGEVENSQPNNVLCSMGDRVGSETIPPPLKESQARAADSPKGRTKPLSGASRASHPSRDPGYLQDLVYKLSKVGQAIENNDLEAACLVLGKGIDTGWVKTVNLAFTKLSSNPEKNTEVETFNSYLASLITSGSLFFLNSLYTRIKFIHLKKHNKDLTETWLRSEQER